MTDPKMIIKDETNDRMYFTIVPNYILNHSTAIDQALYLQMKRVAGERDTCFMSQTTMCKRLGIGRDTLRKSLDYLLEHGWIEYTGNQVIKTSPVNTYKMNNIWEENNTHYSNKKSNPETDTSQKSDPEIGKSDPETDMRAILKQPLKKNPLKKNPKEEKGDPLNEGGEPEKTKAARAKIRDIIR